LASIGVAACTVEGERVGVAEKEASLIESPPSSLELNPASECGEKASTSLVLRRAPGVEGGLPELLEQSCTGVRLGPSERHSVDAGRTGSTPWRATAERARQSGGASMNGPPTGGAIDERSGVTEVVGADVGLLARTDATAVVK
jgi:hypothetical protein